MFLCMIEFSSLAQLVLFLKGDWAYTAVAAGGLLAFCQAAGAIGKPVSGLVSDRLLGRRRRPALIALAGTRRSGLRLFSRCILLGQTWSLRLALALLGGGAVGWGGRFGTLAGEIAGPTAAGAAAGVTAAIDNIGIFIGPPLFWLDRRSHRLLRAGLVDDARRGRARGYPTGLRARAPPQRARVSEPGLVKPERVIGTVPHEQTSP